MSVDFFKAYHQQLNDALSDFDWSVVEQLAKALEDCWREGQQVFICGNGGSAGNAIHLANDYLYGIAKEGDKGLRATALPANPAMITCLANDEGYDQIFSLQLQTLARSNDLLLVLSGSGNSPNVVEALKSGRAIGMRTAAILGFSGGKCKTLADLPIHFPIDDMQIAEDLQLVVGHMLMQWLSEKKDNA